MQQSLKGEAMKESLQENHHTGDQLENQSQKLMQQIEEWKEN